LLGSRVIRYLGEAGIISAASFRNRISASGRLGGAIRAIVRRAPLLLYGIICVCIGLCFYLLGVVMVVPRYLFGLNRLLLPINEWIVWYSGVPIMAGFALVLADLLFLFPSKRRQVAMSLIEPLQDHKVTVALTAYNDEQSIVAAVEDFISHPLVHQVIVVSNNSTDETLERARAAGAVAYNESAQGYGHCVHRCLSEAVKLGATELIVLCEGDRTFRAHDLDKFIAYASHAEIVNGTRIVERIQRTFPGYRVKSWLLCRGVPDYFSSSGGGQQRWQHQ
jgi:hypothetical protein